MSCKEHTLLKKELRAKAYQKTNTTFKLSLPLASPLSPEKWRPSQQQSKRKTAGLLPLHLTGYCRHTNLVINLIEL